VHVVASAVPDRLQLPADEDRPAVGVMHDPLGCAPASGR
jgi:hypothetical protein